MSSEANLSKLLGFPQAKAFVRAYARSGAELEVSSDGAEFVLAVPHLPRGLLQDLGVGDPDAPGLACAVMPPSPYLAFLRYAL